MEQKQPWLGKPVTDILFILSPPFLSLLVIILFPGVFQNNKNMPDSWWIMLILLVDVAHVYSTLYRTYFNSRAYEKLKPLLISIPVLSFIAGAMVYTLSDAWFWRLLAYLAVYHFVRQQYGFMKLYSRHETPSFWQCLIDKFVIYYATIYPLLFWHLNGKRNFNWFIENEFLHFSSEWLLKIATIAYWLLLSIYVLKETYLLILRRYINIPKVAVIAGTLLSWYFGIIYFNGDLAFTLLNVISHGIPYMALIWIYGKKESVKQKKDRFLQLFFGKYGIVFFLGLIFLLAYVEEGIWDLTVWKEHKNIFSLFHQFSFHTDRTVLSIVVPLLALPQITHYIIDGFIWKRSKEY